MTWRLDKIRDDLADRIEGLDDSDMSALTIGLATRKALQDAFDAGRECERERVAQVGRDEVAACNVTPNVARRFVGLGPR